MTFDQFCNELEKYNREDPETILKIYERVIRIMEEAEKFEIEYGIKIVIDFVVLDIAERWRDKSIMKALVDLQEKINRQVKSRQVAE